MASGSFEWGWDAFIAIGTLALAIGTFLLALSTWRAARASAEDVRAQWRPVVTPGSDADVKFDEDLMWITVRNVGRGAAYYIDAALGVNEIFVPAEEFSPGKRVIENLAVLPAGEDLRLSFDVSDGPPQEAEILIDYADLNGRPYSTRIEVNEAFVPPVLRMAKVELSDNRERIPWKPWTWERPTRRAWLLSKFQRPWKKRRPPKPEADVPF
jgi:hypothetical protein